MRRSPFIASALTVAMVTGCGPVSTAASESDCERDKIANIRQLVEEDHLVEDSAVFERARDDMSLSALVKMLGPATRDIGSGLHIFIWEARDGSTLRASAGGLCERVMRFDRTRR
jgi:hypothetical protein